LHELLLAINVTAATQCVVSDAIAVQTSPPFIQIASLEDALVLHLCLHFLNTRMVSNIELPSCERGGDRETGTSSKKKWCVSGLYHGIITAAKCNTSWGSNCRCPQDAGAVFTGVETSCARTHTWNHPCSPNSPYPSKCRAFMGDNAAGARSAGGVACASMGDDAACARSVEGPVSASMGENAAGARSAKRGSAKQPSSTTAMKSRDRPRQRGPPSVPEEGGRKHRLTSW
jgi:hypothetical protein